MKAMAPPKVSLAESDRTPNSALIFESAVSDYRDAGD